MSSNRILILDKQRIELKLERMAYQIWEHNAEAEKITLLGIAQGGTTIAERLATHLKRISRKDVSLANLTIDKKNPSAETTSINLIDGNEIAPVVVLVDDVANSGKTLLYALQPILAYNCEKIMIAVLVDRKHKTFPVSPDIVGHSLATTLHNTIVVDINNGEVEAAFLE